MKSLAVILSLAFATGLGFGVFQWGRLSGGGAKVQFSSAGPTIEQITQLSELAILRVQISDVLKGEHGDARIAVLVRGDADISIDLSKAEIIQKNEGTRTCTVVLPQPQLVRPRVDHERTKVYKVENTTWFVWRDNRERVYQDAMKEAQRLVEYAAGKEELKGEARKRAETVLRTYFKSLGWGADVQWQ